METTEKLSRSAVIAELESVAKDIAKLFNKAKIMLSVLQEVLEDTQKEQKALVEILESIKKPSNEEPLSLDELAWINNTLFGSELCAIWNIAADEQETIEQLHEMAMKICMRIERLSYKTDTMFQNYPD